MKRLGIAAAGIVLLARLFLPGGAEAQPSPKIPRIGIVFMGGRDQPHLDSFKQGLRERGYSEGTNIVLEYRYADGKNYRLFEIAKEFVRDKVDVIVTTSSISAQAARKATRTLPIVMTSGNPVEQGLAESLSHPGGNVTGLTVLASELSGKRLELLKESFPKTTRVATLWNSRENESMVGSRHEDFQSSCRGGTMCIDVSLYVSIQAFNGRFSRSILPIRTHSVI